MELFCFGSMGFQHLGKSYVIAKVKSSTDYCSSDKKAPEQQVEPELWGRRGDKDVVVSGLVFLLS